MNLKDALLSLIQRAPATKHDDDSRLRAAERRIEVLDAMIGAQQARQGHAHPVAPEKAGTHVAHSDR